MITEIELCNGLAVALDAVHIPIPDGNFERWDEYIRSWPQDDTEWLDYYDEFIDSLPNGIQRDVAMESAAGASAEELMQAFGISRDEVNLRCLHALQQAHLFGISKKINDGKSKVANPYKFTAPSLHPAAQERTHTR